MVYFYNRPVDNYKNICPAWLKKNSIHHSKSEKNPKILNYYKCKLDKNGNIINKEYIDKLGFWGVCNPVVNTNKNAFVYANSHQILLKNDKIYNKRKFYLDNLLNNTNDIEKRENLYRLCTCYSCLPNNSKNTQKNIPVKDGRKSDLTLQFYKYNDVCKAARVDRKKTYFSSYNDFLEDELENRISARKKY